MKRVRWRIALRAVLFAAIARQPDRARADDRTLSEAGQRTVEVTLVGDAALDPTFPRRIASWFDKDDPGAPGEHPKGWKSPTGDALRVDVVIAARLDAERILSPEPRSGARVWVALRGPRSARLFFVRGAKDRGEAAYLVRDIRLERGLDEMGSERVAEAIHFSVRALLEGDVAGERAEIVQALEADAVGTAGHASPADRGGAPAGTVEAAAPRRAARSFDVGLGYGAALRGDEGLAHGPRATVRLALGPALGVTGSVRTALPVTSAMGSVDVDLYGASLGAGIALRPVSSAVVSIDLMTGPRGELVHYRPVRSSAVAIAPGDEATELRPAWDFGARATFEAPIRWALVAECTVALERTHYDVAASGSPSTIGRPWAASPGIGLEVRY